MNKVGLRRGTLREDTDIELPRNGPATRYKAEGKTLEVELMRHAFTPLVDEQGNPRSRIPSPYLPIVGACSTCAARCCRLIVKLSLPDAIRYCNTLQVPFFVGLRLTPSAHLRHSFKVDNDPRVMSFPENYQGAAEIMLRRRDDGACASLLEIAGHQRCGVYGARPTICRQYPLGFSSPVAKGGPEVVICQVPYGVTPQEEEELKKEMARSIEDWELHDDVVEYWNQQEHSSRTVRDFLEFAIPVTAKEMDVGYEGILSDLNVDQQLHQRMVKSKVVPDYGQSPVPDSDKIYGAPQQLRKGEPEE